MDSIDGKLSNLEAHCDFDWGGSVDRKSMTGSSIWLNSNLVSWFARKQLVVSLSSVEAKLKAVAHVTLEIR